jgi:DNA-binding response OmpR family regulator
MPNFSGLDLCQVIRNDPSWQPLPVLILLPEREDKMIAQVFMVGADDYIQKPIIEPELIARLLHCIERSRHNQILSSRFNSHN